VLVRFESWRPRHEERTLDATAVEAAYRAARDATFTVNDLGDDVLIVAVGAGYCVVSLLTGSTWYHLLASDAAGEVEVELAGQPAVVPAGAVLPQEVGLEVLKRAGDVRSLLAAYTWSEQ